MDQQLLRPLDVSAPLPCLSLAFCWLRWFGAVAFRFLRFVVLVLHHYSNSDRCGYLRFSRRAVSCSPGLVETRHKNVPACRCIVFACRSSVWKSLSAALRQPTASGIRIWFASMFCHSFSKRWILLSAIRSLVLVAAQTLTAPQETHIWGTHDARHLFIGLLLTRAFYAREMTVSHPSLVDVLSAMLCLPKHLTRLP